jgi:ATP-dependent protease ClpP protease subunit
MKPWYEFKARAPSPPNAQAETTEVMIYGDIGESWFGESITAAQFVKDLQAIETPNLTVRINSFGGSVPDGLAIYNALRRYPGTVSVEIDGMALSIASLIAMAGSTVRIAENALLMIHAPWSMAIGNSAELRGQADLLDKFAQSMTSSYVRKSGKSADDVMALLTDGVDHWYSAAEALEAGFVDEITEPMAISASARIAPNRFKSLPAAAAAFLASKEQSMPDLNPAANPIATPAAPAATPQAAAPAVYARSGPESVEVRTFFAAFKDRPGVPDLLADVLVDASVSPAAASSRLLAHLAKDVTPARPAGSHPHIETLQDETDVRRGAAVHALMARAGIKVDAAHLQGNPVRSFKLLDHARASLQKAGVRPDGMGQMELVAAAFTQGTSDFPILLENTMNKSLQAAYATAADTWSRFCGIGSVSDFRATSRYRVGSLANLDLVNELAEFKNRTIPDGEKASITAVTKGNIVNISRQAIINDDLGAFVGLSAAMGRAARRTIEADVYALLGLNSGNGPVMPDSVQMFNASHGNLAGSGAVPSVSAIDVARAAMAAQRDVSNNDYLDLRPAVGLFTLAQGGNARVINGAQYDPDTANKLQRPNMVAGLLSDIIDSPRVSGTSWYLFADPAVAPAIEVAFLDGVQEPFLEMMAGFTVDGAQYKVRLDFGVAAVEYKSAYRNPGA